MKQVTDSAIRCLGSLIFLSMCSEQLSQSVFQDKAGIEKQLKDFAIRCLCSLRNKTGVAWNLTWKCWKANETLQLKSTQNHKNNLITKDQPEAEFEKDQPEAEFEAQC